MFATQRGVVPAARCALAVSTGKAVRGGVRRLGRGSGSRLPGVVALAIDPGALAGLAGQIRRGSVLVTGSNGKGTTCRMLAEVMLAAGLRPFLNFEGSNQLPGGTAAFLAPTGLVGRPPRDLQAIGLVVALAGLLSCALHGISPHRSVRGTPD